MRLTTSLLVRSPLYAAAAQRTGSPTGNAGSFSPFQVVNPTSVEMTYASEPTDGRKNVPLGCTTEPFVTVRVAGEGGTGWQGVQVRIDGFNNNGSRLRC